MHYYCTYFDINYAARALVLHESLQKHDPGSILFALCLDDTAHKFLECFGHPQLVPIKLAAVEASDYRLASAKKSRSRVEYYFTLSPFLPLYIFAHFAQVDLLTYVDADLCFFSPTEAIYNELSTHSVLITEHRFTPSYKSRLIYGRYNVGILVYRRDEYALAILNRWADQCIDWCYDRVDQNGRFADQKYLDVWPDLGLNVCVSGHPGINLAPWNVNGETLIKSGEDVYVGGHPVVCFHFHGLSLQPPDCFGVTMDYGRPSLKSVHWLYRPYAIRWYDHLQACKLNPAAESRSGKHNCALYAVSSRKYDYMPLGLVRSIRCASL